MGKKLSAALFGIFLVLRVTPVLAGDALNGNLLTSLKDGSTLYQVTCSVCHGEKGDGKSWVTNSLNPPPKSFTDEDVIESLDDGDMYDVIANGRAGTAMQPFKDQLSKAQIDAIIDFIRTSFMKIDGAEDKKKGSSG